ncbi:hypothetical protein [Pseudooceanicola onchidii]|uniref:hypothetical protein n=1 Tax=Pseudooceanicola onchidii TaxID=2562279 RepID=UPI0010AA9887|nr:hypothetical protein [Pseudooceanicola onchidii]
MTARLIPALSLLAATGLALPALAETRLTEVRDRTPLPGFGINSDIAEDLDVIDANGRTIGEVSRVVGPDRNTAQALVVEFEDYLIKSRDEERLVQLTDVTFDGSTFVLGNVGDLTALPMSR